MEVLQAAQIAQLEAIQVTELVLALIVELDLFFLEVLAMLVRQVIMLLQEIPLVLNALVDIGLLLKLDLALHALPEHIRVRVQVVVQTVEVDHLLQQELVAALFAHLGQFLNLEVYVRIAQMDKLQIVETAFAHNA